MLKKKSKVSSVVPTVHSKVVVIYVVYASGYGVDVTLVSGNQWSKHIPPTTIALSKNRIII